VRGAKHSEIHTTLKLLDIMLSRLKKGQLGAV
jgi:hypothetical protein